MSEPLLKIPNHHAATCGDPPIVNGEESHFYIGYFENEHGEQRIFTRDRKTGIATLRSGDIGWNELIVVTEGTGLIAGQSSRSYATCFSFAQAKLASS
jgi:hypothetical protein